jgi:isopropylmalate/homocitrate/citramalate synthase
MIMTRKVLKKNTVIFNKLPIDFNWNFDSHPASPKINNFNLEPTPKQVNQIELVAEDLRDGLHGIRQYPAISELNNYIDELVAFGFKTITVGIYNGKISFIDKSVKQMLTYLAHKYPQITPILITLTNEESLEWINECRKYHPHIQVLIFMGTSPTRQLVEEWSKAKILADIGHAVKTVTQKYKLVAIATPEQATQTEPDFLEEIIRISLKNGAQRVCLADTIGTSRPVGTVRIITFIKKILKKHHHSEIPIDWHGHDDLGNGHSNAMAAISAGAARIHTVARGIGERAGNTKLESVVLNCVEILHEAKLPIPWKMKHLHQLLSHYDSIVQLPEPSHGPLSKRAFKTSLGIHTSAMLKAKKLASDANNTGQIELAEHYTKLSRRIYCAVEPELIGRQMEIFVGPWSGVSTVHLAAIYLNIEINDLETHVIENVLLTAKKLGRELTSEELTKLLKSHDHHHQTDNLHS